MKNIQRFICGIIISLIITSCTSYDPRFARPYLHRPFELKQDMYVCQVSYRIFGTGTDYGANDQTYGTAEQNHYYMRNPQDFTKVCEDSMYSVTYRTVPTAWPRGVGDSMQKEWLIAKLPTGTKFVIDHYTVPPPNAELPTEAYVTIVSGPFTGLQVEWMNFNIIREVNRPYYPYMGYTQPGRIFKDSPQH